MLSSAQSSGRMQCILVKVPHRTAIVTIIVCLLMNFSSYKRKESNEVIFLFQGLSNLDELVQQSIDGNLSFGETFEEACALSDEHQKVERQLQVNKCFYNFFFLELKIFVQVNCST